MAARGEPRPATPEPDVAPPSSLEVPVATDGAGATPLDLDDVRRRFVERVIPRVSRSAQLLLKASAIQGLDGQRLTIALPSEEMRQNTDVINQGLRSALDHEFKVPLTITWTVDASLAAHVATPPRRSAAPAPVDVEPEESYSIDESAIVVESVADHLITEMFPGAKELP